MTENGSVARETTLKIVYLKFMCFIPSSSSISPYFLLLLLHFSYFSPSTTAIYTPEFINSWKYLENTGNYGKYWPRDTGAGQVPPCWWRHRRTAPGRWLTYVTYFILKLTHRKNEARLECILFSDLTITLINNHNIKTSPAWEVAKKYQQKYGKSVGTFDTIKTIQKSAHFTLHQ